VQKFNSSNIQEQFPQDSSICYLNHAAVSPWPLCTQQAVTQFAQQNVHQGATDYLQWMKVELELRQRLAALIHTKDITEIALAKSTSEALSIIAYGIAWQAGDEIIISDQEFPSNRIIWESLADRGVKVIEVPIGEKASIETFENAITPSTRLLSISSVQYASGQRIDLVKLGTLCRQNDVMYCVDAIQSLGTLPFDQNEIQADFIVGDGHKWMMAAEGLSLLYVKQKYINTLKLHQFGWHMVKDKGNYDEPSWEPATDATRFESGSPNMLGIHALHASLGLLLSYGISQVHQDLEARVAYLIEQLLTIPGVEILSPIEPELRAGIVTFRPAHDDLKALYQSLMDNKVICAYRGGGIRFSPGFYTPYSQIDKAILRLKEILNT